RYRAATDLGQTERARAVSDGAAQSCVTAPANAAVSTQSNGDAQACRRQTAIDQRTQVVDASAVQGHWFSTNSQAVQVQHRTAGYNRVPGRRTQSAGIAQYDLPGADRRATTVGVGSAQRQRVGAL